VTDYHEDAEQIQVTLPFRTAHARDNRPGTGKADIESETRGLFGKSTIFIKASTAARRYWLIDITRFC